MAHNHKLNIAQDDCVPKDDRTDKEWLESQKFNYGMGRDKTL